MQHILTVDLEDWFHGHYPGYDYKSVKGDISRVEEPTDVILELLDSTGSGATFFVLGAVADKYPGLIRRIANNGHKIACHGWGHDLIDELGAKIEEHRSFLEGSGRIDTNRKRWIERRVKQLISDWLDKVISTDSLDAEFARRINEIFEGKKDPYAASRELIAKLAEQIAFGHGKQ